MERVGIIIVLGALLACGSDRDKSSEPEHEHEAPSKKEPKAALGLSYSVVSDDVLPTIKRTVAVELPATLKKEQLAAVADEIKAKDERPVERTYINFDIKNTPPPEQMAHWAVVRYDPDRRVDIYGDEP